ncbi:BBP7 family outer membrane beta-barrel protein [Rubripirellula reticaptiva]|uniref:Outer membrane protein beta-barrel domain-containing protein n=1 Tax=Rubripirellula reticaptiva TaxID=2528013 RepID=A0A5C6EUA6_9BACT|nr:BBP7 family outer membrane beta-barrel protein [Rubripirellula reticaptiva]TWU51186.1 hypothetical protein Poly59_27770 [Rubripirellula reticaptiva]
MKTNVLRNSAVAIGLGIIGASGVAQAQSPYSAPSRWNNFRPVSEKTQSAGEAAINVKNAANQIKSNAAVEELPAPIAAPDYSTHQSAPYQAAPYQTSPMPSAGFAPCEANGYSTHSYSNHSYSGSPQSSGACGSGVSAYSQAVSSNWDGTTYNGASSCNASGAGARPALFPYFGGANLLFFTLEEGAGRQIATGTNYGTGFNTSLVDPGYSTGFDISAGRYLDNGRFGLGLTYLLWNPGEEQVIGSGAAGAIRASMPQYRDVSLNFGSGPETVYDQIDGASVDSLGATNVRVSRDLQFQGIEANLYSFGLMGAQRAAYAGCGNGSVFGRGLGLGSGCGYGGATGPLARSSSGRVRVMTSHGFRWLQIDDSMETAYNVDGAPGYQAQDIYDNVDVENNLMGYQFGGMLNYCMGKRLNLNIGGKFGLYGNRAELKHRLGTETQLAYLNGDNTQTIDTTSTDTVLATLGELDLGLGYRISNAWTITGGYRVMGITGVASADDNYPNYYSSVAASGNIHADDSYLLHGGYLGMQFNW